MNGGFQQAEQEQQPQVGTICSQEQEEEPLQTLP